MNAPDTTPKRQIAFLKADLRQAQRMLAIAKTNAEALKWQNKITEITENIEWLQKKFEL